MEAPNNGYAVILAGGGGTRLWPKSRQKSPKHLLKLFGDKSLLRLTYERISDVFPAERILVITQKDHIDEIKSQLPEIPGENIIGEPASKNTALAMGTASAFVHVKDPTAAVIFLAADHLFKDIPRFQQNVVASLKVALLGEYIVSIGVRPTFAHTGLGYIKIGEELDEQSEIAQKGFVFRVREFKEKPNLVTAQSFVASNQYLWNANLYSWSTETIFIAFKKYSPGIGEAMSKIAERLKNGEDTQKVLEEVYSGVEDTNSIDYEISEKADNILVIPGDFGWSDIGDWNAVYENLEKDTEGNVFLDSDNKHISINSKNTLVETSKRLIVTVGVEDLVVIDTEDAILIAKRDSSQDVKKAVEKLKEEKKEYL
jgi:mannose-1-phosphate guanylyltransferase